jgi:hypothetical protein
VRWTDDELLQRIRDWAEEHDGVPPSYEQWRFTGRAHPDWEKDVWPTAANVKKRFGSWSRAIRLAGFEPLKHVPRMVDPPKVCEFCGVEFERGEREGRDSFLRRKYCSSECAAYGSPLARAAADRLDKALRLRAAGWLNSEIAEAFGTSRQAIANMFARAVRQGYVVPESPYWQRAGRSG